MTALRDVFITGVGSYSPGAPVPFDKIDSVLGRLDKVPPRLAAWIERMQPIMAEMLGIRYCHYALDPVTRQPTDDVVSMCDAAARKALEAAGLGSENIDLLVYGGVSTENICPPTSVLIQERLRMQRVAEYSIHSNCTSVYKALQLATDQIGLGRYRNALIVSAQLSSPFLRAEHYNQAIVEKSSVLLRWFLSDGAGALVLTADPAVGRGHRLRVRHTYIESIGLGLGPDMYCLAGGHRMNPLEMYENGWHHLCQNFDKVAELSVELAKQAGDTMLERIGMSVDDFAYFLINVPTKHIFDRVHADVRRDKGATRFKFYSKLAERGYPGPAAIVHALDEFLADETPVPGDIVGSVVAESSKWMYAGFALEYLGRR